MERGESIITLAQKEVLLHCNQLGGALGSSVVCEGGRKEQRVIDDVVIGGGGDRVNCWLVHLLKFVKLHELATEGCVLFDDIRWKFGWVTLHDECTLFPPFKV